MTSKSFAMVAASIIAVLVVPFMAYNFVNDDFGLFWSNSPKRIWFQEKTSKYLMSFRYIPRNFDGLLIGPSYSDGSTDTRTLEGYRIYNLSMDGGNATELRAAALNVIERGNLRVIIICLTPYLTMNSGIKGDQISPKEYWGSLFSLLPLKLVQAKWALRKTADADPWAGSEWGTGDRSRKLYTWDEFVRYAHEDSMEKNIDPVAYQQLGDIVRAARQHDVRIFAYFFPYNVWSSERAIKSGAWQNYREKMLALFDPHNDVVWDMMGPEYISFRQDASCYTDGHLSKAGIALELADIRRTLDQTLRGISSPPIFPRSTQFACLGSPGGGSGYDRSTVVGAAAARVP